MGKVNKAMRMKRQGRSIQTILFRSIFAVTVIILLLVFIVVSVVLVSDSIQMYKQSRLDVLRQIVERSTSLNNAMQFLANDVYDRCAAGLASALPSEYAQMRLEITGLMSQSGEILNQLHMFPSIIVLMKNGYSYHTSDVSQVDIAQIRSSYWYIDNMTNTQENFWSTRYYMVGQKNSLELCYAKSIRDAGGEYLGVIVVGMSTDYLQNTYSSILDKGSRMYILDSQGKAISHSVPALLGTALYYMPYFRQHFREDESTFVRNNTEYLLHTNVYSPLTGWTIVEEIPARVLLKGVSNVFWIFGLLFLACLFVFTLAAYLLARVIAKPIVTMSHQIKTSAFQEISPQTNYNEVLVLSSTYNQTVKKMNDLIAEVKRREKDKRKLELAFLQAQINPHFLHNTLFSIKCLVEMGNGPTAGKMLNSLIKLLKIPINVKKEWCLVSEEIDYLEGYLDLMAMRYENKKITMDVSVPDDLKNALIPRLLLQPIVENSIYHGFDEGKKNALIRITFQQMGKKLVIRVQDNGRGMTREALDNLWQESSENTKTFNRVGLVNVKNRIKLLYGEEYGISIVSEINQGTETILTLGYQKEVT